jgi:hypothetical protein
MNKFGIDKIVKGKNPKAIGIAGLANKPTAIRTHDDPVVPKESFWSKLWRIIWK